MIKKEHKFSFADKVFIFVLEYLEQLDTKHEEGYPFVNCLLYRQDDPAFNWVWEGYLEPEPAIIEFGLVYDDQVNIEGHFNLYQSESNKLNYFFMDTRWGIQYEEHFEGNLFEIGEGEHPISPIPPITGPNPMPIAEEEQIIGANYKDLFPYLYLQYWPEIRPSETILLIKIPKELAEYPFYKQLLEDLKLVNARSTIEQEALKYINGNSPYEDQFIQEIGNLPFPLPLYIEIYDYLYHNENSTAEDFFLQFELDSTEDEMGDLTPIEPPQILRIWGNIIALCIINGYDVFKLEQLSKILIVNNLLEQLSKDSSHPDTNIKLLIHASLVLPDPLFPLPPFSPLHTIKDIYNGSVIPYAIGDLQMVQHKLKGYRLGDLARIENVMAGELKKSKQRKTAISTEIDLQQQKNFTSNSNRERTDALEREVTKTIANTFDNTINYDNLKVSYGPPTTGIYNGKVTENEEFNSTETGPIEFAKQILTDSLSQIDHQINHLRHQILRNEKEESSINIIDNRRGQLNIKGLYYWLNRVYNLRLINYGHRFLIEFLINKPFINALNHALSPILIPPIAPEGLDEVEGFDKPILNYTDIAPDNYLKLGRIYNLPELPTPPPNIKLTSALITGDQLTNHQELKVFEGYIPDTITVNYNIEKDAILLAGVKRKVLKESDYQASIDDPLGLKSLNPEEKDTISTSHLSVPVAINTSTLDNETELFSPFFVNLLLSQKLSDEKLDNWKREVYAKIQHAYHDMLKTYQEKISKQFIRNPAKVNKIIKEMVKNACEDLLWQAHLKFNNSGQSSDEPSEIIANKPAYFQFFANAFEWHKMTITLDDKPPLNKTRDFVQDLEDNLYLDKLAQFLEAGQLRVIVPLHRNANYKLLYYLKSGLVFYGKDHLTPVFEEDEATVVKIKEVFEFSANSTIKELQVWEQTVPTEMQWLQDGNANHLFHSNPD